MPAHTCFLTHTGIHTSHTSTYMFPHTYMNTRIHDKTMESLEKKGLNAAVGVPAIVVMQKSTLVARGGREPNPSRNSSN